MTYVILRRRGTTDKQHIQYMQNHLNKLHEENFNLKQQIKELEELKNVTALVNYNEMKNRYEKLKEQLVRYNLWDPRNG